LGDDGELIVSKTGMLEKSKMKEEAMHWFDLDAEEFLENSYYNRE
jgi:hypothetical protein